MKRLPHVIALFWMLTSAAQGELLGVSTQVDMTGKVIEIRQDLALDLYDSITSIQLKMLVFEGTSLGEIAVTADEHTIKYKTITSEGMKVLELILPEDKTCDKISISYPINVKDSDFYLPLFFTNLPAAASNDDFFNVQFKMPLTLQYRIHFPKVDTETTETATFKTIALNVPALPSLLRMTVFTKEKKGLNYANIVDVLVIGIFIGIGFLIWVNRKQLIYG